MLTKPMKISLELNTITRDELAELTKQKYKTASINNLEKYILEVVQSHIQNAKQEALSNG